MEKFNLIILLLSLNIVITVHVLYQMSLIKKDTANIWDQIEILVKTVAKKLGEIKTSNYIKNNKKKNK